MKIWLLEHDAKYSGSYTSAVVVAENEQRAREIHPDSTEANLGFSQERNQKAWESKRGWAETPESVVVTLLGTAEPELSFGVWCAEYYH